jgi:predicted transcriptional regulator
VVLPESICLLYAIGEIALVVIGILIALQINNWNEERKARIAEKLALISLKEEFQKNSKDLQVLPSKFIFMMMQFSPVTR